eukprot:scaffold64114_cov45-Phaeocystis_antarctica.AAC.1
MKGTLVALSLAVASALQPGALRVRASAHATPRQPAVVAVSSWYDAGTRLGDYVCNESPPSLDQADTSGSTLTADNVIDLLAPPSHPQGDPAPSPPPPSPSPPPPSASPPPPSPSPPPPS